MIMLAALRNLCLIDQLLHIKRDLEWPCGSSQSIRPAHLPDVHHTRSVAPGSRADSEQSYGSFGRCPIIFGSAEGDPLLSLMRGRISGIREFESSCPSQPVLSLALIVGECRRCRAFRAICHGLRCLCVSKPVTNWSFPPPVSAGNFWRLVFDRAAFRLQRRPKAAR